MANSVSSILRWVAILLPAIVLLAAWQVFADGSAGIRFFFSSPVIVLSTFGKQVLDGTLIVDFSYTLLETAGGFCIGVFSGMLIGMALLRLKRLAVVAEWYALVLGSIPIFAIAPMALIWFGIGLEMKIALSALSTVFVALSQAYRGGRSVSPELQRFFVLNGASRNALLQKLILPMSLDWVFSSLRLSGNLALLGAFVGEYMASDRGLGHQMLKEGGLYHTGNVLAAALAMMLLVVAVDRAVSWIERRRISLIQRFAVDSRLRAKAGPIT